MAHKVSILNESNFDSEVLSPASTVMVQISTPWCGPCRTLTPIFEKIAEEVGDACKMCKIDVEDNYHIASRFQITYVPTVIIFRDGKVVDKIIGLMSKQSLVSKINGLIKVG